MIIGFYPICGDVIHVGHIMAIQEASANCDYLIIGLNCTPDGKAPIQSISERFLQLKHIQGVDEVIPYQGREDLERLIPLINYHIRFLGEDYIGKTWDGKLQEEKLEIQPYFLRRKHNYSSTDLKQRICASK